MAIEPDRTVQITCIELASTNVGEQNLYVQDANEEGEPWKRIRSAKSTMTPFELAPGESRSLKACVVELEGGGTLIYNDEDRVEVGIVTPRDS